MRVATLQSSQSALSGILARQAEQDRLQGQLASGLRVAGPGDDPLAASQAELARSQLARVARDQKSVDFSTSQMNAADGALGQGVDVLQSVRDTLVAAGNAALSAADRSSLADSLRGSRERLLAVANTRDASGGFIFSGQGANSQPITGQVAPGYLPAAGTQRVGPDGRYQGSEDGETVFFAVPRGNGVFLASSNAANTGSATVSAGGVDDSTALTGHRYQVTVSGAPGSLTYGVEDTSTQTALSSGVAFASGQPIVIDGQRITISGTPSPGDRFDVVPAGQRSVFETIDAAIQLLENRAASPSQYNEQLGSIQIDVDSALNRFSLSRTQVGEALTTLDASSTANSGQKLALESKRSDLTDLDYAQAISEMQTNQTGLQAALRSYASFARLSLFDALG